MTQLPCDKVVVGGLYRHFKGPYYRVTDVVRDSEALNHLYVVYYDIGNPQTHRSMRPLEMFIEDVDKPEFNYRGPRFKHVPDFDDPPDWKLVAVKLAKRTFRGDCWQRIQDVTGLSDEEFEAIDRAVISS